MKLLFRVLWFLALLPFRIVFGALGLGLRVLGGIGQLGGGIRVTRGPLSRGPYGFSAWGGSPWGGNPWLR